MGPVLIMFIALIDFITFNHYLFVQRLLIKLFFHWEFFIRTFKKLEMRNDEKRMMKKEMRKEWVLKMKGQLHILKIDADIDKIKLKANFFLYTAKILIFKAILNLV